MSFAGLTETCSPHLNLVLFFILPLFLPSPLFDFLHTLPPLSYLFEVWGWVLCCLFCCVVFLCLYLWRWVGLFRSQCSAQFFLWQRYSKHFSVQSLSRNNGALKVIVHCYILMACDVERTKHFIIEVLKAILVDFILNYPGNL